MGNNWAENMRAYVDFGRWKFNPGTRYSCNVALSLRAKTTNVLDEKSDKGLASDHLHDQTSARLCAKTGFDFQTFSRDQF